jgi:putative redox protein
VPGVKAVATIAAPFDVQHVTRLFGDGLQTLLTEGEAEVRLDGRPFKMRRAFIDDLGAHDQGRRIAELRLALLVLHAPGDRTVDISNAGDIFQAAHHPKSFVSLDDADHLLTRSADAAYAAEVISAWAARYIGRSPPRAAADRAQVVVEETGLGNFQVEVAAGGVRFIADEPVDAGGLGTGPTPYDLLSAGLGACTAMTLRLYARRKGLPLRRIRVGVGHAKVAGQEPSDAFVREIALEGDLTSEQRARLLEMAERCPVHASLQGGSTIGTREVVDVGAPSTGEDAGQHARDMQDLR